MSEKTLHRAVCDYLRLQYPQIMFNSDLAGATKLTMGQAVAMKALRSNRGFPDLVIYEPRGGYHGLFIELKKEGEKLIKRNGDFVSDHVAEQSDCMGKLGAKGYNCFFAIGFDEAKTIIDNYLNQIDLHEVANKYF
jgi:hypothetical protein